MGFEFYEERDFKDTELGPLPVDWKVVRLGEVAETFSGGTPRRDIKEYYGGNIKWLKSGELKDNFIFSTEETITPEGLKNSSAKYVDKGTLLIAMYGATAGKVGYTMERLTINQAICAIKPKIADFYSFFYFYFFQKIRENILSLRYGGAQPNLNQQIISNLSIPLPPLEEQKAIAEVLRSVQLAIEKTEEVIRATKELKKSMMKHLFTYGYVPVDETDKVKLKETEIGFIPEHWEVVNFSDVVNGGKKYSVGSIKKMDYKQYGKFPIIDQGKEFIAGYWDNEEDAYNGELPVIIFGDHTRIFKYVDFRFVCGADGVKIILPQKDKINPLFFFYYLSKLEIPNRGYNRHFTLLKEISVPLPPLEEQKAIAEALRAIDEKLQKEEEYKKALQNLFKSLLHHLMSGKIRVRRKTN